MDQKREGRESLTRKFDTSKGVVTYAQLAEYDNGRMGALVSFWIDRLSE